MHITDEILKDFFYCKLKAYYKSQKFKITNNSFYYFEKYLKKQANKLFLKNTNIKIKNFYNMSAVKAGYIYSINSNLDIHEFILEYHYIEITKDNFAIPIFMSGNLKIFQEEKQFFAHKAKLLEAYMNMHIQNYKIVLYDGTIKKIKLQNTTLCATIYALVKS